MDEKENFIEKLYKLSPYVRRAWDHTMPLDWKLDPWYIYDYEILYVMRGQLEVTIEDKKYEGNPGDVFFFTPYKVHSLKSVGQECVRQPHIHFDFYYDEYSKKLPILVSMPKSDVKYPREDLSLDPMFAIPPKTTFNNPSVIENLILNLIAEKNSARPHSILKVKSLLLEILFVLFDKAIQQEPDETGEKEVILKAAVNYISENCEKNLSTEDIAHKIGYSKNYFSTIFKQYYGISPCQYHRKIRIQKAKNLLNTTQMSITQISVELGFDSVSNFCRFFKHNTDTYPEEYRKARY